MFFKGPFLILMLALFSSCTFLQSSNLNDRLNNSPTINTTVLYDGIAMNGNSHATCIINQGQLKCWGSNFFGSVGDGTQTAVSTPYSLPNISNVMQAETGQSQSCAVISDGTVKCWGTNDQGQLGDGSYTNSYSPLSVPNLNGIKKIIPGYNHTCAIKTDDSVICWGNGDYGMLGNGSSATDQPTASSATTVTLGQPVLDVTAANNFTCALLVDATVRCWGANYTGQLGDGTNMDSYSPVTPFNLNGVTSIHASGENSICSKLSDDTAKCWGTNYNGQLGDGTTFSQNTPTLVALTNIKQIGIGREFGCALLNTNEVKCWGSNAFGQLGDGTLTDSLTPVNVPNLLSNPITMKVGMYHVCIYYSPTVVQCWGRNDEGQLGRGTITPGGSPSTPELVIGL